MFRIEQSAFLQALGRAIGNSLWQVAAIWLLYAAVTSLYKLSASRRYQLATLASMLGFVWFVVSLVYTYATTPTLPAFSPVYSFTDAGEVVNRSSFVNQSLYLYHSVLASLKSLSPYISCAYLLVFMLLGIRLFNGFRQVKFFATQGLGKVDVQWRLFVQRNAEILQIKQQVKVFTSHYVKSPLTMGFWKPIILLPVASLNNLSTQQVEAILLHELAHIRRHDYLVNIFVQIAETSLFFNPFMRLLLKQIRQERENCCDDYVLQFQYSAKDYAKALLTIEKNNAATLLALSVKDNQSFQLLNRVKRMVAPQPHAFNYRQQLSMLLLLTILGLGFTIIVPKPKIKTPAVSATQLNNNLKNKLASQSNTPSSSHIIPAPFDLVKTIQGISNFAENIDTKAIQENAEAIGEHAEAMGRAYGEEVEKAMQPYVEEVTKWAAKFPNNDEALAKLELAAKDLDNMDFDEKTLSFNNIDEHLVPAMQKLNEAMKSFPKMNFSLPHVNIPIPAMPAFTFGAPAFSVNNKAAFAENAAEARLQIANERAQHAANMEKSRAEMKKAIEQAKAQYRAQINDLNYQQNAMAYSFNNKTMPARVNSKIVCDNKRAGNDDEDNGDDDENNGSDNDDIESSEDDAPEADANTRKGVITYTVKLPAIGGLKSLGKNLNFEFNNETNRKTKGTKKIVADSKVVIRGGKGEDINISEEELENLDIKTGDIRNIDIQKQKRFKNGKEENVVVIRIIPSK